VPLQLVDQLAEQERLKEDEELLLMSTYPILDPAPSHAAPVPYAPVSAPSQYSADQDAPFEPSASRQSSTFSRRRSQMTLTSTAMTSEAMSPPGENPTGLVFDLVDPTGAEIVDPVLASGETASRRLSPCRFSTMLMRFHCRRAHL
jgi:hypothetical protein